MAISILFLKHCFSAIYVSKGGLNISQIEKIGIWKTKPDYICMYDTKESSPASWSIRDLNSILVLYEFGFAGQAQVIVSVLARKGSL